MVLLIVKLAIVSWCQFFITFTVSLNSTYCSCTRKSHIHNGNISWIGNSLIVLTGQAIQDFLSNYEYCVYNSVAKRSKYHYSWWDQCYWLIISYQKIHTITFSYNNINPCCNLFWFQRCAQRSLQWPKQQHAHWFSLLCSSFHPKKRIERLFYHL